jgi:hypothetical protein
MSINFVKSKKLKGKHLPVTIASDSRSKKINVHLPGYSGFRIHNSHEGKDFYYKIISRVQPTFYNQKSYRNLMDITMKTKKICYGIDFIGGRIPIIICTPIFDEDCVVGCFVELKEDMGDEKFGDVVSFQPDSNTIAVNSDRLYVYDESRLFEFLVRLNKNILDGCSFELDGIIFTSNEKEKEEFLEIDRQNLYDKKTTLQDGYEIKHYKLYYEGNYSPVTDISSDSSSESIYDIVSIKKINYECLLSHE